MALNARKDKKYFAICSLVFLCFLSCSSLLFSDTSQTGSQEEQMVKETLKRFKLGIELGDLEVGRLITTEDFYPFFKGFYESLAAFSQGCRTVCLLYRYHGI